MILEIVLCDTIYKYCVIIEDVLCDKMYKYCDNRSGKYIGMYFIVILYITIYFLALFMPRFLPLFLLKHSSFFVLKISGSFVF